LKKIFLQTLGPKLSEPHFLVDASFGKNAFVENTTLQQAFYKENHQAMKFKVLFMKMSKKSYNSK